jgi:rhodanese-related sulfurtransferase
VDVPEVEVAELAARTPDGVALVDVRELDEFAVGHVPGAVLIPLADVPERIDEIPDDQPVYVICAVGNRSARAVEYYLRQGIDAVNVAGGTKAWIEAGHPVETGAGAS